MLNKLLETMRKSKGIPAVEGTVNEILTLLHNDKSNKAELIQLITSDVALTQKILKLASSPMYSSFNRDISTVSEAISILGVKALVHIVLGAILISAAELDEDEELAKVLLASEMAKCAAGDSIKEKVAIAALLYDIGIMLSRKFLPAEALAIDKLILQGIETETAQRQVLGMTLHELGLAAVREWKLSTTITTILDNTGDVGLIKLAKFSNTAASFIFEGRVDEIDNLIEVLDIELNDPSKFNSLVKTRAKGITVIVKPPELRTVLRVDDIPDCQPQLPLIINQPFENVLSLKDLLVEFEKTKYTCLEHACLDLFKALKRILTAKNCLLLKQGAHGIYSVTYALDEDMDELGDVFVINTRGDPNVFVAAITNTVEINIGNITKLNAKSVPLFFKEKLSQTRRFLALPMNGTALIYIGWEDLLSNNIEELLILKKIRDKLLRLL
jgi:HD-like signal output (HDOD) protein